MKIKEGVFLSVCFISPIKSNHLHEIDTKTQKYPSGSLSFDEIVTSRLDTQLQTYFKEKLDQIKNEGGDLALRRQKNKNSGMKDGKDYAGRDVFPKLDQIDYGCFCRNLTRISSDSSEPIRWYDQVGHPVDLVDKLCKYLTNGWSCLKSQGVDLSISYSSPGRLATSMDESIELCEQMNQNLDSRDLCKVEEQFSTGIIQAFFSGYDLGENPITDSRDRKDTCHPGNGFRGPGTNVYCCDKIAFPKKQALFGHISECDASTRPDEENKSVSKWKKPGKGSWKKNNSIKKIIKANIKKETQVQQHVNTIYNNTCTCLNGTPNKPKDCPKNGAESCYYCDSGYHMTSKKVCQANKCYCENGVAKKLGYCEADLKESCQSCDEGYWLEYESLTCVSVNLVRQATANDEFEFSELDYLLSGSDSYDYLDGNYESPYSYDDNDEYY